MIDDVVGETPVVLLQRVGPVRLKLEVRSPNATVMDRVAKALAADAGEAPWREAGDGALAIAVAMQGALNGKAVEVWLPENVTLEVRQSLLVYRAKVTLTPFAEGPAGGVRAARAVGPLLSDRFPERRTAALAAIGDELIASEAQIDAWVAPGELLRAVGPVLQRKFPALLQVEVRPFSGAWRPHRQAGVFAGNAPTLGAIEPVDDATAWAMRARLGREEGLLLSIGTAATVEAARRVAQRLGGQARVYAPAFDTGERDFSLAEQF